MSKGIIIGIVIFSIVVIGGSYFLVAYYLMGAKMSITGEVLGFANSPIGPFAFLIDLAVAVLIGALLQSFIDRN